MLRLGIFIYICVSFFNFKNLYCIVLSCTCMLLICQYLYLRGWSGLAMSLGNIQCRGVRLICVMVGQGPTVLAVGSSGDLFGYFFSHLSYNLPFSLFLGRDSILTESLS